MTIYHRPVKKRYNTGIELTRMEWDKMKKGRLKDYSLRGERIKMNAMIEKAQRLIDSMPIFSFKDFEAKYFDADKVSRDLSIKHWFNQYERELEENGQEGSRICYRTTMNSLLKFKPGLKLDEVTTKFLVEYENEMTRNGNSPSTIGIYLRHLRAIMNRAIKLGALQQEQYSFANYSIPSSRNIKKALSDHDLKKLLDHRPQNTQHEMALDFWVLSYLSNGMNMTDILHLKTSDIDDQFIYYRRQKTIRTKKTDNRPIKVPLHPRANEIVEKWKTNTPGSTYLFPFLENYVTPKSQKHRIQRFLKTVNSSMIEIGRELGIKSKLGTYVARHTFSTRMMRAGASTHLIKESLGHSSVTVTENYLGDFPEMLKSKFSAILTDFSTS